MIELKCLRTIGKDKDALVPGRIFFLLAMELVSNFRTLVDSISKMRRLPTHLRAFFGLLGLLVFDRGSINWAFSLPSLPLASNNFIVF